MNKKFQQFNDAVEALARAHGIEHYFLSVSEISNPEAAPEEQIDIGAEFYHGHRASDRISGNMRKALRAQRSQTRRRAC